MKTNIYFLIVLLFITSCVDKKKKQSTFNFKHFVYQNFEKKEKLPQELKTIKANTFNFNDTIIVNLSELDLENVKSFKKLRDETSSELINFDIINDWDNYKKSQHNNIQKMNDKEEKIKFIKDEMKNNFFYIVKKVKITNNIQSYIVLKKIVFENPFYKSQSLFLINSKNNSIKSIIKISNYFLSDGDDKYFYSKIIDKKMALLIKYI